jgi:enamine deaminase RidA (YjgF/YER057c/UK114 family)
VEKWIIGELHLMTTSIPGHVEHINPDGLSKNPAFTQVVTVTGPGKTIYIGGQDSVDASGTIVGKGDIKQQVEQVFKNLQSALKASGAELEHIIKWNI